MQLLPRTAPALAGDEPTPRRGRGETLGVRLSSGMRLLLATVAPVIFAVDHGEHVLTPFAAAVLALFFLYSAAAYVVATRAPARLPATWLPWLDVGWTTLLIAFSSGTSSIYFPLYLFATLCAAFQGGFRDGAAVVIASVLSFSAVGGLTAPTGASFELDRSLIRPAYLLVLGYLISCLGEHEVRLEERLGLLREVVALSNPRFGMEHMVSRLAARLREFHGAASCRVVVQEPTGECWMRSATASGPRAGAAVAVPSQLARILLPAPETAAFLCGSGRRAAPRAQVLDAVTGRQHGTAPCAELVAALEAASFVSVPFSVSGGTSGRVYLTSTRRLAFNAGDAAFLVQVAEQVLPLLEKVKVVDQLASGAADEERRRIARDIHDTVVQPYVGFGLGLSAVRNELAAGRIGEAGAMVDRLLALTHDEVRGLRTYVHSLRDGGPIDTTVLDGALRRFCTRFSSVTGIAVDLSTHVDAPLEPRLAGEVLNIVAEGLSNVRRHAEAPSASVRVAATPEKLTVDIENEPGPTPVPNAAFSPRSLTERATALGGDVAVHAGGAARTAVKVSIPL